MNKEQAPLKNTVLSVMILFYLHHERAQDGSNKGFKLSNHADLKGGKWRHKKYW